MDLKEENYPIAEDGGLDLTYYTDPPSYYAKMHDEFLRVAQIPKMSMQQAYLAHSLRVHSTWGLIAKGAAAIPHALKMLKSKDADAREDGASILGEIGRNDSVVDAVLSTLANETNLTAKDSLILALGELRSRRAIPMLAAIIRNESEDGDTRWTAVESLGRIARRRFLKQGKPIQAAIDWLQRHEPNPNERNLRAKK